MSATIMNINSVLPIIEPVGFDPVWFGVIMIMLISYLNLEMWLRSYSITGG